MFAKYKKPPALPKEASVLLNPFILFSTSVKLFSSGVMPTNTLNVSAITDAMFTFYPLNLVR